MKKIILSILMLAVSYGVFAQIDVGGMFKNKANQRANQKADDAVEKALDEVEGKNNEKKTETKSDEKNSSSTDNASATSSKPASVKSYSKFDFIPGNKVLFYEDFATDAIGDFPARWNTNGTGETVTLDNAEGKWLKMSGDAIYIPDLKNIFPENFTVEFDMIATSNAGVGNFKFSFSEDPNVELNNNPYTGKAGFYIYYRGTDWEVEGWSQGVSQRISGTSQAKPLDSYMNQKVHFAFWIQKQRMRLYINEEKVFDLPRVITAGTKFNAVKFITDLYTDQDAHLFISNIRMAEATADMRSKLLTEGKFSTSAITFDVNSDKIRPESYGIIKEIATVLKENPDLRIRITGHTDSDGKPESNLDLSKRRALAVKKIMETEFAISSSRFETDGKGSKEQLVPNSTAENKAVNRRVEFVKL